LFRRRGGNGRSRHFRARIESCVTTILELDHRLGEGKIRPEIIQQFQRLKESLRHVSDDTVDESDIFRIEQATNQLLQEIRMAYGDKEPISLFTGNPH